jgi:hypothetical protein
MTRNETPTVYIGGPLHGQVATRTGNRWSIYRDDEGKPIPAARGSREICGLTPRLRRFYAHQSYSAGVGLLGSCYVHATTIRDWSRSGRPAPEGYTPVGTVDLPSGAT